MPALLQSPKEYVKRVAYNGNYGWNPAVRVRNVDNIEVQKHALFKQISKLLGTYQPDGAGKPSEDIEAIHEVTENDFSADKITTCDKTAVMTFRVMGKIT